VFKTTPRAAGRWISDLDLRVMFLGTVKHPGSWFMNGVSFTSRLGKLD
jgi:hypothetical protein